MDGYRREHSEHRREQKAARFLNILLNDKQRIDTFNKYQPGIIVVFVVAFVLLTIGSIYGAIELQDGVSRNVVVGTGFSAWVLLLIVAILYGVAVFPPAQDPLAATY